MPYTHQEQVEHSLAAERRRMRLIHHDTMQDLLNNKTFQRSISEGKCLNWWRHFPFGKDTLGKTRGFVQTLR